MDNRPIGVFDSGLGGLTTVRELKKIMPDENIVYFGDTGRVPYGTRSPDTVLRYSRQDVSFLLSKDVKMVIVACNTATATLGDELKSLPVPGVGALHPAVKASISATRNNKIGIIGTPGTVKSGAYEKAIKAEGNYEVTSVACPLFVPLVENGYTDRANKVTRLVAEEYLYEIKKSGADTLILGCTHYPIIKSIIADIMGNGVTLINSGQEAAHSAKEIIESRQICGTGGKCSFYVSDSTGGFADSAFAILGEEISGETKQIDIDKY